MDTEPTYATPLIETARDHIARLHEAFMGKTRLAQTYAGKLLADGDPKFWATYHSNNFTLGRYDTIVQRFSALWPEGLAWPDGVPRQAPAAISDDELRDFRARISRAAGRAQED